LKASTTGWLRITQAKKKMPDVFSDPLRIIASAVTPVVMVSATAILISGVNARHISISDRIRSLSREYRGTGVDVPRKRIIQREVVIFQRRLHLVSWATRMLYASVGCFILMALLISVSVVNAGLQGATLVIFLLGLVLIAIAIILELIELQESNSTIELESADILTDKIPQ
jgi:hypothetical protein